VKKRLAVALLGLLAVAANAQVTSSVLGSHNLSSTMSPIEGGLPPCLFCHAPHNGQKGAVALWSQKLSTVQNYTLYSSDTLVNQPQQPVLGRSSNLCLSCHDGTVAPGQTAPYGAIKMTGSMYSYDVFGQDLSSIHPFNFKLPLQTADNLLAVVTSTPARTANPSVHMIDGNVQCETCHNAHVMNIDSSNMFLVVDNSASALCLACHTSTPSTSTNVAKQTKPMTSSHVASGTVKATSYNAMTEWSTSVHAQGGFQIAKAANAGPYGTLRKNGCLSCHTPHKAQGKTALLSPTKQTVSNMDATAQTCMNCHNGGSTVSPAIMNVYQEFSKKGHPFPSGSNMHVKGEAAVLNKNRHATCVDCHEAHASQKTSSFASVTIRPSQNGMSGVSAVDGNTVVSPATNQYQVCLRCHGSSTGKQALAIFGYLPTRITTNGDALNLVPALSATAISSHPISHDRQSTYTQPSLRAAMWNIDGRTQGRLMGTRLLCTDCHNSDDNREFGGSGPNGPHGSQYNHILERRYEFSQVAAGSGSSAGPGTTIQNLLPVVVDPSANGPYSLCAKCHDLTNILSNASFSKHSLHITAGFSCSVCHTAHGVGTATASMSGERLVSFDVAVVAENDVLLTPITYNRANGTCTLKCHNYNHNSNGTVTLSQGGKITRVTKR
jgi:predicted CXXCH cytochrome family protein